MQFKIFEEYLLIINIKGMGKNLPTALYPCEDLPTWEEGRKKKKMQSQNVIVNTIKISDQLNKE